MRACRAQFRCVVDVGIGMFKFDVSVCVLLTSSTFVCFRFWGLCFVSVGVLNCAKICGYGRVVFGVVFGLFSACAFRAQYVMHFLNFSLIDLVIICMLIIFAESFSFESCRSHVRDGFRFRRIFVFHDEMR